MFVLVKVHSPQQDVDLFNLRSLSDGYLCDRSELVEPKQDDRILSNLWFDSAWRELYRIPFVMRRNSPILLSLTPLESVRSLHSVILRLVPCVVSLVNRAKLCSVSTFSLATCSVPFLAQPRCKMFGGACPGQPFGRVGLVRFSLADGVYCVACPVQPSCQWVWCVSCPFRQCCRVTGGACPVQPSCRRCWWDLPGSAQLPVHLVALVRSAQPSVP